jgi:hypothetical protein
MKFKDIDDGSRTGHITGQVRISKYRTMDRH